MTYGIFDKEELKFEKQLEALLTEAPPKRKPGHWSDIYARAGWKDDPSDTPAKPEKPKDDTEGVPVVPQNQNQTPIKLNKFDIDTTPNLGGITDNLPLGIRVKNPGGKRINPHPEKVYKNKTSKRLAPTLPKNTKLANFVDTDAIANKTPTGARAKVPVDEPKIKVPKAPKPRPLPLPKIKRVPVEKPKLTPPKPRPLPLPKRVVKPSEPEMKSDIGKTITKTNQPKPSEEILKFAKRLGYDNVADFEKAQPLGTVKQANGTKYVLTGVDYIPKKDVIQKPPIKIKTKPDEIISKPKPSNIVKKAGGQVAKKLAKAPGYLVPGLNAALLAYDVHELMLGTAGAGEDAELRQTELTNVHDIIADPKTSKEKKLSYIDSNLGGWQWDNDSPENDPPIIGDNLNVNASAKQLETELKNLLPHGPYTQKDIERKIQDLMKTYNLSRTTTNKMEYIADYRAKLKVLRTAKESLPTSRLEAHKQYLTRYVNNPASAESPAVTTSIASTDTEKDTPAAQTKPVSTSPKLDPRVQNVMKNSYKKGTEGFPTSFGEYENLMQELSKESGVPIQMLRALGLRESGIHVKSNGKLSGWNPVGDKTKGTGAALGIFHVRSSKDGAAVEEYNDQNGTNYDWKDTASNPRLAATIGAWYFKYWLDQTGGDPIQAYMHYNGGPGGNLKPLSRANAEKYAKNLDYFRESKFIKKSSILEGIAKAA